MKQYRLNRTFVDDLMKRGWDEQSAEEIWTDLNSLSLNTYFEEVEEECAGCKDWCLGGIIQTTKEGNCIKCSRPFSPKKEKIEELDLKAIDVWEDRRIDTLFRDKINQLIRAHNNELNK